MPKQIDSGLKIRSFESILLSILLMYFCLISNSIQAQKVESMYLSEFDSGSAIYVITNRVKDETDDKLRFENEVKPSPHLDFLKVWFYPPDSIYTELLLEEEFLNQISSVHADWLLFIHGDSKTYEQAVMRGFDIQHLHDINVIVFSWPTKDPDLNGIKNFKNSKHHVSESMDHFSTLIGLMETFKNRNSAFADTSKLSILFHSLGNLFMENYSKERQNDQYPEIIFDHVILNSAAVNQKNHKSWVEQINFQERLFINSNKSDFNLKGVRIFTKDGKQLGEKVEPPLAQNAIYVDFSKAVGFRTPTGTTHTFFIGAVTNESKNIHKFYRDLFHGDLINFSDTTIFDQRKDSLGFDIIF